MPHPLKRPSKKSKARSAAPPASRDRAGRDDLQLPVSASRQWLFRLIAVVIIPLMVLGGLEAGLRLFGYGYEPGLFKKMTIGGRSYWVNNDSFAFRFFPPQMARFPGPIRMAAQKPAGTYRIFILGESAAMGDPEPAYGAGRYLEALLSARYPQAHFEVVNLGITAIDSHVILPIARDCARRQGDLWIIYMGNNEMVGPFGAATVFGAKAPPLPLIRLNLAIQTTRLGQLLENTSRRLKGGQGDAPSWGGMEMFVGNQLSPDDPRKEVVYQNFSRNLDDLVRVGLHAGAKILLNTVAVNLKDCAPFASLVNSNLPSADRAVYERDFAEGVLAENQGDHATAVQSFAAAAKVDPKVAELQFRWGECLLQLTNAAAAREHLQLACDDDALPFRADSRINAIIRNEPAKTTNPDLMLFDAAAALSGETSTGICGRETFFEHVHFNFDGNYRLGRAWADQIAGALPPQIAHTATTNDWNTQAACDQRLGLSDWNRSLILKHMIGRLGQPPLSTQLDNRERVQRLQQDINGLQSRLTPAAATATRAEFSNTVAAFSEDPYVHENFALFLELIGDFPAAVAQCRSALDLIPQDSVQYYQYGRALLLQNEYAQAESAFHEAVALRPSLTDGWIQQGNALALQGQFAAALASYETALKQQPQDSETLFRCGKMLAGLSRHPEAMSQYRAAIRQNPGNWEAHYELGGELDAAGQTDAASHEFGEAARLNPGSAQTRLNYGVLLAKQGQLDAAQQEFEASLRIDPNYARAQAYLVQIKSLKRPSP
jgi:tetratricopeptide (TPR) repeat protein